LARWRHRPGAATLGAGTRDLDAKPPETGRRVAPPRPLVKKRPSGPIPPSRVHVSSDMAQDRSDTPRRGRRPASGALAAGAALIAVLVVALAFAAAASAPPAAAAPSLGQLQKEARRTRTEMSGLQTRLQDVGQKLVAAQLKLQDVNIRLQRSRLDLGRAETALETQREILAQRAATMYKQGEFSWLDLLSSITSFADIDTIRSLQRAIADEDRRSENDAQRLAQEARRLERQVETDHAAAVAAQAEVQNQKLELDQRLAERTAILQEVTKRIKKILASGGLKAALAMARNGQFTQLTWAQALLVAMRLPVTADNVAALTAWEMAEGGHWYNTAYYNPLNTTQDMPGATVFNSVGVKAYTSWKQGLAATMKTLRNGYYGAIIDALRRGNDAAAVAQSVGSSPWGTGDFSHLL
jgi:peptidoglycan hydrolase CwlO-like protein